MANEFMCEAGNCRESKPSAQMITVSDPYYNTRVRFCCKQHLAEWAVEHAARTQTRLVEPAYDNDDVRRLVQRTMNR